eukprot:PhM_4_TR9574/c0_g1_i1/m.37892
MALVLPSAPNAHPSDSRKNSSSSGFVCFKTAESTPESSCNLSSIQRGRTSNGARTTPSTQSRLIGTASALSDVSFLVRRQRPFDIDKLVKPSTSMAVCRARTRVQQMDKKTFKDDETTKSMLKDLPSLRASTSTDWVFSRATSPVGIGGGTIGLGPTGTDLARCTRENQIDRYFERVAVRSGTSSSSHQHHFSPTRQDVKSRQDQIRADHRQAIQQNADDDRKERKRIVGLWKDHHRWLQERRVAHVKDLRHVATASRQHHNTEQEMQRQWLLEENLAAKAQQKVQHRTVVETSILACRLRRDMSKDAKLMMLECAMQDLEGQHLEAEEQRKIWKVEKEKVQKRQDERVSQFRSLAAQQKREHDMNKRDNEARQQDKLQRTKVWSKDFLPGGKKKSETLSDYFASWGGGEGNNTAVDRR